MNDVPTKFERIFRLAKELMHSEGMIAKEAILKAVEVDDEHFADKHPDKDFFAFVRNVKGIIQKAKR